MHKRRRARELALQAAYALEMSANPISVIIEETILQNEEDSRIRDFATGLVSSCLEHKDSTEQLIKEHALNWDYERIAVLDRLIMRLAIAEFLYFDDIPPKVSIDEAIEIAKKYSTEKSSQFINGILDGILAKLKQANRLNKQGRGLQ